VAVSGLALGAVHPSGPAGAAPAPEPRGAQASDFQQIRDAVTPRGLREHLLAFRAISKRYGSRTAGTNGYAAASRYVEFQLREAGYRPTRQYFDFTYQEVVHQRLAVTSPEQREVDSNVMEYSPSTPDGGITAELVLPSDPLGCTAAAWDGIDATGKIALVSRGSCPFADKSRAAGAAGAVGVIIYNNADGELNGTLGGVSDDMVPSTGITQDEGNALVAAMGEGPVEVLLDLQLINETRRSWNILAQTRAGDADNVVMLGAHLDGEPNTQAINDNGTGTAALLETAQHLRTLGKVHNKVRFAFWGAEENGLIGSTHYVNQIVADDPGRLDSLAIYLNFDMLGSPNYITGLYDADESSSEASAPVPAGSIEMEEAWAAYFKRQGLPYVDTPFSGRSDYQAFILNGVPAGGVFSGGDGVKTQEQAELFGGEAGVAYDPNYHTPRDNMANVFMKPLHMHADAIAHMTLKLSRSTRVIDVPRAASSRKAQRVRPGLPDGVVRG
jgi:Zn-dependent M28 family amino/carboxypeptidase